MRIPMDLDLARRSTASRADLARRPRYRPALEGLESRRLLSTITWDGDGDGTSFAQGMNWVGDNVPGPSDSAVIDVGGSTNIELPAGGITVNSLTQTGGTLTLPSGTISAKTNPSVQLTDCVFNDNGVAPSGGSTVNLIDSTINLGPNVTASGNFLFSGACTLNGQIPARQVINVEGSNQAPASLTVNGGATNLGAIDLVYAQLIVAGNLSYTNAGTITFGRSEGTDSETLMGNLVNQGTIMNESGFQVNSITTVFYEEGGLALSSGSSLINESGGLIDTEVARIDTRSGTLINQAGGTIKASGSIDSTSTSFLNNGTLNLVNDNLNNPGSPTLTIFGTYNQSSTGTMDAVLDGLTREESYTQMAVTGAANLAGTLNVTLSSIFTPSNGNDFEILTFASSSGNFSTENFPTLSNGLLFLADLATASLTLEVGPAPQANLAITLTAQPASVTIGGSITYTATVTDTGPDDAEGVVLTDNLPQGVTPGSITVSGGSYTISGYVVTDTIPAIAVGDSAVLTITETPANTGTYIDSASVASTISVDKNVNNSASAVGSVVPPPSADLAVSITGPSTRTSTGLLTFTTSVTNNGPNPALGSTLTDTFTLPTGAILSTEQVGQGTVQVSGNVVTANFGTIPKGITFGLTVVITTTASGTFADSASVTSMTTDPNPANNSASSSVNVQGQATISLTPSASFSTPKKPVTLSAQVSVPPGFAAATRSVTFYDGSTALGSAPLNASGHASLVVTLSRLGAHSLSAIYSGDSNYSATTSMTATVPVRNGVLGDFDGDGKADIAIYDQTSATFYIEDSGGGTRVQPFGNPADKNIPVTGDFDGDGKTDIAIYDQTASIFYILYSGGGSLALPFGNSTHVNVPIAGDFDGDGKTDIAVYDQTSATFEILDSGGGSRIQQLGNSTHVNVPIASDFDDDGKTDLAFYDQTAGVLYALESGGGVLAQSFGNPADLNIPVAMDFDGDGRTDIAIYDVNDGEFFILYSDGGSLALPFGNNKHANRPA